MMNLISDHGLKKWNLDNLLGIEILNYNPLTKNPADVFTTDRQNAIADKLSDPNNIPLFINNKKDLSSTTFLQIDSTKEYQNSNPHYDNSGNPNLGWIIVVPNSTLTGYVNGKETAIAGKTDDYLNDDRINGIIKRSKIEIRPEHAGDSKISHEFGHAFIAPNGEASILSNYTIMNPSGTIPLPADADIKAGKIIYEDSYLPREKLDDILGLD